MGRHVQHGERAADPKAGISGIAPMGKGNEAGWNWTNFLFEAGGDIEVNEGGKVKAVFNSEAGVKALDFYKKLRWEANAIPQDWARLGRCRQLVPAGTYGDGHCGRI